MGYYADLIKQKQEKRNSAESHLKGLIGKKFKRDTDLERAVNSSIYTEISDWSHPRMVVFDKYTDEKYILTTEDNNQYGKNQEFWISKVQKANSKEEKDNANFNIVRKFYYKECLVSVIKLDGGKYSYIIEKDGREEGSDKSFSTQSSAETDAKKEVEAVWNEKEEKDNEAPEIATARRKALQKLEDAQKKANWYGDETMKKLKHDLTYADEENLLDVVGVLDRYLPKFEAKVKSFGNEKEEKENESKSQIEKRIKDAEERIKLFQRLEKEVQAKLEEGDEDDESRLRRQRESYRDGIIINQSLIDHLKKELKTAKNEKEEEGYYAKLAEEKKNGDMDKGGKIYWDCINAHKKLGRAYGNLFNAVGGVEEIINYGVDPETNFSPELARKLESWTRIIENCERQLRTIR